MPSLEEILASSTTLSDPDIEWLHNLTGDWQFIADLAFADLVMWAPTNDNDFVAIAHARPSGSATVFYRDLIGQRIHPEWRVLAEEALAAGAPVVSPAPDWFEHAATRLTAIPVRAGHEQTSRANDAPIAVITKHANLSDARTPSRLELTYIGCANDVLEMISDGTFPDYESPAGPRRGAPRVNDGIFRLNADGVVTFASPNGLSAYSRLGFEGELEGKNLAEVTSGLLGDRLTVDESLPLVVTGRASWRCDIEGRGVTVTLRSIPIKSGGERIGALVMLRDVTDLRRQEQELLTKDATIREIHHRVKNNLQTVASLLRIQARRSTSDVAREALMQAMRRVSSIAVVHDTLSRGLDQSVDFDSVFDSVLRLTTEVASADNTKVYPRRVGSFGTLPSRFATPLALALTELVTNAVEHGLQGRRGEVTITVEKTPELLTVVVADNGVGLPEGKVGSGLGTQIVRTLIEGELHGTIDWHTLVGAGTEVTLAIPRNWEAPNSTPID